MSKILIRQEKEDLNGWHVAAQGEEEMVKNAALSLGRKENKKFVMDKTYGDVKGDKTSFFVMEKSDFKAG